MPWRSGCWMIGVAKVESHTVMGPAMAPTASRSTTSRRGLAGVSTNTTWVLPGRTAAAMASVSVPSTNVTLMPNRGACIVSSADVTEKICRWATMWSPLEHRPNTTADTAAIPDANARADSAPSSAAMASSNSSTDGLPKRL
jgi:hypothetical protein